MSKIGNAIYEFQTIDALAKKDTWLNRIHPLVKLFLTVFYIALTVSFHKYDLTGLLGMIIYPIAVFEISGLSFGDALRRLKVVLPVVCIVGILNPFFDRTPAAMIGNTMISGGVISMITLMIKAVLTVLAAYLLIATTSIEKICYALRKIHVPQMIVVEILLIYRYITVLLSEARRITQAYFLRAPGQKGVAFKAWGPLLGQMLLRSMDRAGELYESMCIRGFRGEFYVQGKPAKAGPSLLYLLIWTAVLTALRLFPVMQLVGRIFVR